MKKKKSLYTDLIVEINNQEEMNHIILKEKNITVTETKKKDKKYTTIFYKNLEDLKEYQKVKEILIGELEKYLPNLANEVILVVGLGNKKSTPDSLGPEVVNHILVTRHLFLIGEVEKGYSNVAAFTPNVMANTGMSSTKMIECIVKEIKATKVIVIDALKTNTIERLVKTIQISNEGITPGSGIGSNREEISKSKMNIDVIAIGVPTVMNLNRIKENKEDYMITPTNIDFVIEQLSYLLGDALNKTLHQNDIRQKNNLK